MSHFARSSRGLFDTLDNSPMYAKLCSGKLLPVARPWCPYDLLSQYVVLVAPAFCVIDMTLEACLVVSEVMSEHHDHLQESRPVLLRDIRGSVGILGDKGCKN